MKAPGQTRLASIMRTLPDRFWIRLHMSLILLGVTLSGIASGKLLQLLGISLVYRYAITVIVSYGVFLVLIRLWLWFVTPRIAVRRTEASSQSQSSSGSVDLPDGLALPDGILEEGEGATFSGAGGEFGGGGASASFGESASSSSGSSSSGGGFDIGDVDDARALILLAAIAIVAALLAGVWVYIIYQAPVILSEAFLQVLLASGMFKKAKYHINYKQ